MVEQESRLRLHQHILKEVESQKDKISIAKMVKISSLCGIGEVAGSEGLAKYQIELFNQPGKLNGLPLDAEFTVRYGLKYLEKIYPGIEENIVMDYLEKVYA
jgi:hypothetical protein